MSAQEDVNNPSIRRKQDGTYAKGQSGNPLGRPKNTLKDYVRRKFCNMTDEEKEEFLKKIPPDIIWKMGEGNPRQDVGGGEEDDGTLKPILVKFIDGNNRDSD